LHELGLIPLGKIYRRKRVVSFAAERGKDLRQQMQTAPQAHEKEDRIGKRGRAIVWIRQAQIKKGKPIEDLPFDF
jgi:hypothetical protein